MGGLRKCSVLGCHKSTGLHVFPADPGRFRQWVRACGRDVNVELSARAGVCNEHFTPDSFSNLGEVKMGFCKHLRLHPNAVPTVNTPPAQRRPHPLLLPRLLEGLPEDTKPLPLPRLEGLPEDTKPLLLPRLEGLPAQIEPKPRKGPVDIGCQTDRVLTKHAFVQAERKPPYRSKAIQARTSSRSAECCTMTLTGNPEENLVKKKSSDNNNCTSNEVPPQKSQFIVEEDKLMELFAWCPICSNTCDVSKTMTQTLLCVKQRCTNCHFTNEWFSHS